MRFDDVVFYTTHIYYPDSKGLHLFVKQNRLLRFVVDFDHDELAWNRLLKRFASLVSDVIARMTTKEQEMESEKFFAYLIQDPRRDLRAYLQPLLDYFHMLGFLKFKKNIYNDNKQKIVRYRVIFKNKNDEIITVKRYSSLGQLSDDIGKKMTSLHYQLFKVKN